MSCYLDGKKQNHGNATAIFERPDGTRGAIIGYDGFHVRYLASSRIMMLNNIADWVSHETLPAKPLAPVQCLIVPRVGKTGKLHTVTILNVTIGTHPEYRLLLRGVPENSSIIWQVPSQQPQTVDFVREGSDVIVTVPEIPAWGIGYLAFD